MPDWLDPLSPVWVATGGGVSSFVATMPDLAPEEWAAAPPEFPVVRLLVAGLAGSGVALGVGVIAVALRGVLECLRDEIRKRTDLKAFRDYNAARRKAGTPEVEVKERATIERRQDELESFFRDDLREDAISQVVKVSLAEHTERLVRERIENDHATIDRLDQFVSALASSTFSSEETRALLRERYGEELVNAILNEAGRKSK